MPLLLSKPVSPHSSYAVWNIQETNDILAEQLGDVRLPDYHPTRLAEWIVGRILVKNLCILHGVPYAGVESSDLGKPILVNHSAHVSISHSFPLAAAMINLNSPCGIDLERPRQKLFTIQDKFINGKEKKYTDSLKNLCVIWCGKEVLYKIDGRKRLSMKDDSTIAILSDFELHGFIHKFGAHSEHQIQYEQIRDYILAYSV